MKVYYKNIIKILLFGLILSSCKTSELDTFSAKESIYFMNAMQKIRYIDPTDSVTISFGYLPAEQTDSISLIDIAVTGTRVPKERSFILEVDPQSKAKQGVHFEFVNNRFILPADSLHIAIPVKLNRVEEMKSTNFDLILRLKENENFNTDIPYYNITSKKLDMIKRRIYINDILVPPITWLSAYLGDFSKKKLLLMADLLNISNLNDLNDLNKTSISKLVFYANYMQRYLNEMEAKDMTVYEADEKTPMIMGPLVQ